MKIRPLPTRYWFLDRFGRALGWDLAEGRLRREKLRPYVYPELFALVRGEARLPMEVGLRLRQAQPKALENLIMEDAGHGRVAFRNGPDGMCLSVDPAGETAGFCMQEPGPWEGFLPLTVEMFEGLSLLMAAEECDIACQDGSPAGILALEPPAAGADGGNLALLGGHYIPVDQHAGAWAAVGQMRPGWRAELELNDAQGRKVSFFIARRRHSAAVAETGLPERRIFL